MSTITIVTTEQRVAALEESVKQIPVWATDKCAGLHKEISRLEDLVRQLRRDFTRAIGTSPPVANEVIRCDAMPGEESP